MHNVKKGILFVTVFISVLFTGSLLVAGTAPSIEILSPNKGEDIAYGTGTVIALSIYDADADVDISTMELMVDNVDVTRKANKSVFLVTYTFTDATSTGRHVFSFSVKDREGNLSEIESYFNIAQEPKKERKFSYNGTVGVGGEYDKEAEQSAIGRVELDMFGGLTETIDYTLSVEATNEQASDNQPVSSARLDLFSPWGGLVLGDTTPNFTDYSIDGQEVFGLHALPQIGFFGLEFVYGQSLRDVNDPATFKQNVIGGKLKLGNERKFQWGLAVLKVRDDKDSLSAEIATATDSPTPKDNLVVGTDVKLSLLQGKIHFTGEANESLLNEDITSGAGLPEDSDVDLPLDPKNFEWLFIINEHIVPILPGFTSLAAKTGIKVGPFYDNTFNAEYSYVGPSYYSLGNTSVINDRAGFRIWDSLWLLNRKLFLNAAYLNYKNNLQDTYESTTTNAGYSASAYVYPNDYLSINGGVDIATASNEGDDPTTGGIDTVSTTVNGGTTYNMDVWVTNSDLYFNGTIGLFSDNLTTENDSNTYSTRVGADSYFNDLPLDTTVVTGLDFGDIDTSLYMEGGAGYKFLKDQSLYPYTDIIYETGPSRFDFTVGAKYDAPYRISVDGSLNYITTPDTSDLFVSLFATKEF